MAIKFVAASSQFLACATPPSTPYPQTIGFWVKPQNLNVSLLWCAQETATAFGFYCYNSTVAADQISFFGFGSGGFTGATIDNALAVGAWTFVLLRAINTANRRISVIKFDGSIGHAQNTTDVVDAPALDRMDLGAAGAGTANYADAEMAEFWYTNTDIQPDGTETNEALLRQLAYRSPFSVPRIRKDIIEYRSFRGHVERNPSDRVYFNRRYGPQTWTNTNGVTNAPHPPHAVPWNSQYVGPWSDDRLVPVYVPDEIVVPPAGTARNLMLMGAG